MLNYYELGRRIRKYRKLQGLTQEKAAELAELSQKYFSKVERGLGHPTVEAMTKISDILKISLDTLVNGEADDISGEISSMILMMRQLDKVNQQRMLEIMKRIIEFSGKDAGAGSISVEITV